VSKNQDSRNEKEMSLVPRRVCVRLDGEFWKSVEMGLSWSLSAAGSVVAGKEGAGIC